MKVYVAAPYPAREYVQSLFPVLAQHGHECTSTWATGTREINLSTVGASPATEHADLVRHVNGDLEDIGRADALISLTANYLLENQAIPECTKIDWLHTGGRHVELGYALSLGKTVITVGEPENVFQRGLTLVVPSLVIAIWALPGQPAHRQPEGAATA